MNYGLASSLEVIEVFHDWTVSSEVSLQLTYGTRFNMKIIYWTAVAKNSTGFIQANLHLKNEAN